MATELNHFNHIDPNRYLGLAVGVAYGGESDEREISLRTGAALAAALREYGYSVTEYDLPNDLSRLRNDRPAALLIALHGGFGENGELQGWLEMEKIPYTGTRSEGSALAMDKFRTKVIASGAGVPVPDGWFVSSREADALVELVRNFSDSTDCTNFLQVAGELCGWGKTLPLPVILKKNNSGSSYNVSLNRTPEEFYANFVNLINGLDSSDPSDGILIEHVVSGPEYSVGFYDDVFLGAIKITPKEAFYDIKAKYQSGGATTYEHVEDTLLLSKLEALGRRTYKALGLGGVARVDIIGETDHLCLLEANTCPGMTETSLVPKMAARLGYDFNVFAHWLIAGARLKGNPPVERELEGVMYD